MSLTLVWSKSLSGQQFSATLARVKSFGVVCREIRTASGLSQKEVADGGGLDQSRVSEIERGRYLPGLDMAILRFRGSAPTNAPLDSIFFSTPTGRPAKTYAL